MRNSRSLQLVTTSLKYTLIAALISFTSTPVFATDLPTNGNVVAGAATISQSNNNTLNINQATNSAVINWNSFSIGRNNVVNFYQPSSSSVAINNILGNDASHIFGSLNANGHVFIINPNGVIFAPGSQVNVGGLVASTQQLNLGNFNTNNNINSAAYNFYGNSTGAIINQGNIQVTDGGNLALIATQITNSGNITANEGNVLMAAGNGVTVDFGGLTKLKITEGALNTAIQQSGNIKADGGYVFLTAKAAGDLATSVVNHSGTIEAKTVKTNKKGEIILLGDMSVGTTTISGTLDASAPNGGNGGFIETSAAHVNITAQALITAAAAKGKGGTWLIDPYDYVIDADAALVINTALNLGSSVTIDTTYASSTTTPSGSSEVDNISSSGNGDITIDAAINKTSGSEATLTLNAHNNIILNEAIESSSDKLNLVFNADSDVDGGGMIFSNGSDITTNGGSLTFGNANNTVSVNGNSVQNGGSLYVDLGSSLTTFDTAGGDINIHGDLLLAAQASGNKLVLDAGDGDITIDGTINSTNSFSKEAINDTWDQAHADATSGNSTLLIDDAGYSYLATPLSYAENLLIAKTADYEQVWLGGNSPYSNGDVWSWKDGPNGEQNTNHQGMFYTADSMGGGFANNNFFNNWDSNSSQPSTSTYEDLALTFSAGSSANLQGSWSSLASITTLSHYIKETNLENAAIDAKLNGSLNINGNTSAPVADTDYGNLKDVTFTQSSSTSVSTGSSGGSGGGSYGGNYGGGSSGGGSSPNIPSDDNDNTTLTNVKTQDGTATTFVQSNVATTASGNAQNTSVINNSNITEVLQKNNTILVNDESGNGVVGNDSKNSDNGATEESTSSSDQTNTAQSTISNPFNTGGSESVTTPTTVVEPTKAPSNIVTNLDKLDSRVGVSDNGVVVVLDNGLKEPVKFQDSPPDNVLIPMPSQKPLDVQMNGNTLNVHIDPETPNPPKQTILGTATLTLPDGTQAKGLQLVQGEASIGSTAPDSMLGGLELSRDTTLRSVVTQSGSEGGSVGFRKTLDGSGSISAESGEVRVNVRLKSSNPSH